MSAHKLPASPSIEHLKNQAKGLLAAFKAGEASGIRRVEAALRISPLPSSRLLRLSEAQFVIAREYGFASWPKLKAHILTVKAGDAQPIGLDQSDSVAVALYVAMVNAFRNARTLTVDIRMQGSRESYEEETIRLMCRKPSSVRYESFTERYNAVVMINGTRLLAYWPEARPKFSCEDEEIYRSSSSKFYFEKVVDGPAVNIGAQDYGIFGPWPIISPSMFFWDHDHQIPSDNIYSIVGTETVDGVLCDIVSIAKIGDILIKAKHVWIGHSDHLPRRAIRQWNDGDQDERWTNITINERVDEGQFEWTQPSGWKRWSIPDNHFLISPGTLAPDIEMPLLSGGSFSPTQFRGRRVALVFGWVLSLEKFRSLSQRMQRLQDIASRTDIKLVTYDCSSVDAAKLRDLATELGVEYALCLSEPLEAVEKLVTAYRCYASPSFVILDENGVVTDSWIHDFERFEMTVERMAGLTVG